MQRPRRQPDAFTLLEMLVAMALMASIASCLYSLLRTGFLARDRAQAAVSPAAAASQVLGLIERDLAGVTPPNGILAGQFLGADAGENADTVAFYSTHVGSTSDATAGGVAWIELALVDVDGENFALVRRTVRNLLSPRSIEPEDQILCRGVQSWNIRYFDGSTWQDSWDSTAWEDSAPAAVEVTLGLAPAPGEPPYICTRAFPLPCGVSQESILGSTGGL